jgi:NADH dehydrogenase [ubiquinone] 1 alpha subcomplex assembly factor 7
MTALFDSLRARIARDGPITVAQYMAEVLTHPAHGYYSQGDPLGARGDFVTAPEISQMFGELLGLWCAEVWQRLGRPDPIHLVELGPGRGTLMADALRAAKMLPGFRERLAIHLVEVSEALRARQAETLAGADPTWHADVATLPDGPVLVIANEFFDALPIRQIEKTPDGWCERLVGHDPHADRLAFALSRPNAAAAAHVPEHLRDAAPGAVVEVCPGGRAIAESLGARVAAHGGAVLVVDYGYHQADGRPTLQAVRRHARADVLREPGSADLTAHVDFGALAAAVRRGGAAAHGPVTQATLLNALGIGERATILQRNANPRQAEAIAAAHKRLTAPDAMGELFKAMAAAPPAFGVPAGFPEPIS